MKPFSLALLVAFAAALGFCGSAGASNVIVGPSLTGSWESSPCVRPSCTFVNTDLGGTGPHLTSPVTGAVVGFGVVGGSTAGTYRLRTANEPGGSDLASVFQKLSASVTAVPNAGIQTYPTLLPITAGQTIGLTVGKGASMAFREGGRYLEWVSEVPESGQSSAVAAWAEMVGFNAEIQPAPAIAALGATSGPTAGGTSVAITGSDLEGASAVSFGGAPAAGFTVDSASRITAVAPRETKSATVRVAVTTVAGTATGPQFTYVTPGSENVAPGSETKQAAATHCVVPNLKGKKLKAAAAALARARCRLGPVKKLAGATARSGKVATQGSKPGTKLTVGAKVAVTLKPAKPAGKK